MDIDTLDLLQLEAYGHSHDVLLRTIEVQQAFKRLRAALAADAGILPATAQLQDAVDALHAAVDGQLHCAHLEVAARLPVQELPATPTWQAARDELAAWEHGWMPLTARRRKPARRSKP